MRHIIRKEIRRKINRSGNEICPICKKPCILVEHHINGKSIPDAEKWWNKANICSNCHRLVHSKNGIVIEGWFFTTMGKELIWHYVGEESKTGKESKTYIIPVK